MKTFALRLRPNEDLRDKLVKFIEKNDIRAGIVLTCVGSLMRATLRMADKNVIRDFEEKFEIVSLVGTLSQDGLHLHVSLSNKEGNTIGGHLKEGCMVHTTAEIVIGELEDVRFSRKFDEQTGFKELVVLGK